MRRHSGNRSVEKRFELSDGPVVRLAHLGSLTVLVCFGLIVAWMVLTSVDEVAKAHGAVQPESQMQRLQSEFGGSLTEVRVRRGDLVEAGDVIAVFDKAEISSELRAALAKGFSLELERERLLALVEGREPDFDAIRRRSIEVGIKHVKADFQGVIGEHNSEISEFVDLAVKREIAAFESRRAFLENEHQVIDRQVAGKKADIAAVDAEVPAVDRQLAAERDELASLRELLDKGLAPKPRIIAAVEAEADFEYQIATLQGQRAVLEAELDELGERREKIDLDHAASARERIAEISEEELDIAEQLVRLRRQVAAAQVIAPVSGFVQTIPETVVGRVVEPGGLVAEIVPRGVDLRFSAQLAPRDVGFVSPGQSVNLKIDAFDFSRYGALAGQVVEVSPTTIVDERGTAYYEVLVEIPEPFYRGDPERFALLPGMTGEADILTGRKTVFEYVWKPVFTNLDLALSER
ncbi:HlyD family type I secretion periplasmic adaptor subunit [Roseibium sp. Sym1]|uniref:HlyD family type I secretion periplasmic adaptor subunit n=1 Tax=Roseibium sp. Sym1 TaxID=3016006 RepID=UPI0022B5AC29|nr:HlyD family type I secretion periplasmic adaptor subunit [Roseibium sp. Sym1]